MGNNIIPITGSQMAKTKTEEARKAYEEALEEEITDQVRTRLIQSEEVHVECISEESYTEVRKEAEDAEQDAADAEEKAGEAWRLLEEFGGHGAPCLQGALAGTQKLHPLCTCGWNEVATQLERR